MSGINVSNPKTNTNPFENLDEPGLNGPDVKTKELKYNADLAWLDDLAKVDTSAFKIVEKGEGENKKQFFYGGDRGMTFRSGLNRVFGQGKTDEDKAANTASLKAVMDYIKRNTNEGTYEALLNQKIKLSGDSKAKTIQQRIDSGTYVSSKLVSELKVLATRENRKQYVDQTTTQISDMAFRDGNRRTMNAFLGRDTDEGSTIIEDLKGLHLTDAMKGIGAEIQANVAKLFGKSDETLSETIKSLVETGVPGEGNRDYSVEKYPDVWKKIGQFYTPTGDDAKDRQRLERLERHLKVQCDQFAKQGKPVSMADLVEFTKTFLTRPEIFSQFVDMTNHDLVHEMTPDQVFDAIREWPKAQNRPELQNAADWLANQLKESLDSDKPKMIQHVIPKTLDDGTIGGKIEEFIDRNIVETLKQWDKGYDEGLDPGLVFGKVADTILKNFKEDAPPLDLSDSERFKWLKDRFPDDMDVYRRGRFPQQYTTNDFGRLIGDSIESLLVDHKKQMDDLNAEELSFFGDRRKALEENTPPEHLKYVHFNVNGTKPEEFARLGWPTNAKEFVTAKVMPILVNAEMNRGINKMKGEYGEDALDDRVVQQRVVDEARLNVGAHPLSNMLGALDRFAAFSKEVGEISKRPEGFAGLDRETLDRLDAESKYLLREGQSMFPVAKELIEEYGAEHFDDRDMDRMGLSDQAKENVKQQQANREERYGVTEKFREEFGSKARTMGRVLGHTSVDMQALTLDYRKKSGSEARERENAEMMEKAFDTEIQNMDAVLKDLEVLEKQVEEDTLREAELKRQQTLADETLSWAPESLKKQFDVYPEMKDLAMKAENPQLLANYGSVTGMIEGIVLGGHKIEIQSEFTVRELFLTPQNAIDAQTKATDDWESSFRASLPVLDRFADLQLELQRQGGIENLSDSKRDALRVELLKVQSGVGALSRSLNLMTSRYGSSEVIPMEQVSHALNAAAEHINDETKRMLDSLGSGVPQEHEWQKLTFQDSIYLYPSALTRLGNQVEKHDSIAGIARQLVLEPEEKRLNKEYDGNRTRRDARLEETRKNWEPIERHLGVLDRFAELKHNLTTLGVDGLREQNSAFRQQMRRELDEHAWTARHIHRPLISIQQTFDKGLFRNDQVQALTDAFYKAGQQVVDDSKALLTMMDEADGVTPRNLWQEPSFEQKVDFYPSLGGLARQVENKNSITGIATEVVHGTEEKRLNEKYADDGETRATRLRETETKWAPIERNLQVLDTFAEIHHNVRTMGVSGLRDESPELRARLRREIEDCSNGAERIDGSVTKQIKDGFDQGTFFVDDHIKAINDGLSRAGDKVISESKTLLAMLDQAERR